MSRVVRGQLKLSSCVGVGFIVWYRTGVSVGRISGAVGGVPGAGWEIWSYVKKKYKLNVTNFPFFCNC